jgi:hypothetical protein
VKRRLSVILVLFCCTCLGQEQRRDAGKETCWSCHGREQKTVQGTPHQMGKSCEACHGPGELHLKNPRDTSGIFSFRNAPADEVRAKCAQCHTDPIMKHHAEGDVSCLACHSSHHYLKKKYLLKANDDPLAHPA